MKYDEIVKNARNIPELFFKSADHTPQKPIYAYPTFSGEAISWNEVTYAQCRERVEKIASFLAARGVTHGATVAIISGTRPEWMEFDMAILSLGAVSVSIYPSLPHTDCGFILYDASCTVVIAENEEQLNKLRTLEIENTVIPARDNLPQETIKLSFSAIITIEETSPHPKATALAEILAHPVSPQIADSWSSLTRDSVASLVYTSGTTGPSKGVIQTHGNHLANVRQAIVCGMFPLDGSLFLFLPLAHSFARLIGYLGFLTPAMVKFCGVGDVKSSKVDLVKVSVEMRESHTNVVPTVPRLFEKIKATLEERAHARSLQGKLLSLTISCATAVYQARQQNRQPSLGKMLGYLLTAPIRKKVRRGIFGNNFWHAISGGAKMPTDVNHFFWSLGIQIYEGYGLTETCVATNVNRIGRNIIGSVGPALDGIEIKIADDGEILFKGPNITKGYINRPNATRESWDGEGWFHTGDIGHLDAQGMLFITDRKKDIIVTAGGKKVPPLKVENLITQSPFISQALYCGDGKPYCVALVTLIPGTIKEALAAKGIIVEQNLHAHPEVIKLIEEVREGVNEQLSSFEAVKKIAIIPEELTIENGFLTPTLKIKRKVVLARYAGLYQSMYDS